MANNPSAIPAENSDPDESLHWVNHRASALAQRAATARKVSGRRRMIDPATCDREYSQAEMEFMQAMQAYKTSSGRIYPTWGEVLQVIQSLGYHKFETTSTPQPPTLDT